MATLEQLGAALVKADAAGNTDDCRVLAAEIRRMRNPAETRNTSGRGNPWDNDPIVHDVPTGTANADRTAKLKTNQQDASVNAGPINEAEEFEFRHRYEQEYASQAKHQAVSERSFGGELARQGGLTLRAGLKGAVALPAVFADAASSLGNFGLAAYDKITGAQQNGYRIPSTAQSMDSLMTRAGVPVPENAQERVVQDIAGAMAGAGASVGGGKLLQAASRPITQKLGDLLSAAPRMQVISGATSAGASGLTRENGGGAVAQGVAGVLGAGAPSLGLAAGSEALRRGLRGGESGRQRVVDNINLFRDAAESTPSIGQASEGRVPRAVESVLAKTPGGAGIMAKAAQQKADAVAASVNRLADGLAPGSNAVNAGESITKGVQGFKDGVKAVQERLYSTLDQHIPANTPLDVSNTRAALAKLNEGIPGADNISAFFKNSKIKGIDAALAADLEAALAAKAPAGGGSGLMNSARPRLEDGRLPYKAIKKLRTLVGNEIADNSLISDVPRSKWTAVYAALSDDLGAAAKRAGPKAEQSWQWANQYTNTQLARLEQLSGIVGKDAPEKVFSAAMSGTAEGNTVLKRVIDAIPKDNRKELAAAVLRRMGKATAGQQNELGDVFSTETFLTNLNKLSPDSRATLFGRLGVDGTEIKLAQLAGVASNVRQGSKVFANPSGTQGALSAQMAGGGALLALMTGHPGAAAAAAATPIVANRLAKLMTDPGVVNWMSRSTKVSPALASSEMNSLARLTGPQPNQ